MSERKRGGQPGPNNGNWRGGSQEGICAVCGSTFTAPRWEMKHRKYCSKGCHAKVQKKDFVHKTRPHVHVVEKVINMRVPENAVVHHINGDHEDNRPENLYLCKNQSEHIRLHAEKRIADAGGDPNTDKICSRCKQVKPKSDFHKAPRRFGGYRCYCKPCQSEIYREGRYKNGSSR